MMINNWSEVLKNLPEHLKNEHTYIYAACTDKVYWLSIKNAEDKDIDVSKLLELRVFNERAEYRLIRPTIDMEFYERIKEDADNIRSEEYYDQWLCILILILKNLVREEKSILSAVESMSFRLISSMICR